MFLGDLKARRCPVCDADPAHASLFLESSFEPARLTEFSFASRKSPEFMSYRLLRCGGCQTVYAAAAPPAGALAGAYADAAYDSREEAACAADTYAAALRPVIASLPRPRRALEIGAGNGVFLERLLTAGFSEVIGVEPSRAAIDTAGPMIRPFISEGVFEERNFAPESFDLICCFQTLEHVAAPRELTEACWRLLRPGGAVAYIAHDSLAWINRLLGRRSPIIDIEHLQLFCRPSLDALLTASGFSTATIAPLVNRYPLRYWLRLTPLPPALKDGFARIFALLGLGKARVGMNVGNLLAVGYKPDAASQ